MKRLLLIFSLMFVSLLTQAQVIAYDATYTTYNLYSCIDLTLINSVVKGHQLDAEVNYFSSEVDANNNTNQLDRFYTYSALNETLYGRVSYLGGTDYDIAEITIALEELPIPPPPSGFNSYNFCDIDSDNSEVIYLENLILPYGIGLSVNSFCGLTNEQVSIHFYLSEDDRTNGTNPIPSIYNLTQNQEVYVKIENTENSEVISIQMGVNLISCAATDTDNDGVDGANEDVNRNGLNTDDDTDNDGLKNYEDSDDDGDGILTINEDYNNNGDPTDDDTNFNSIPDYLEASVTLSNINLNFQNFKITPNPTFGKLYISNSTDLIGFKAMVLDIYGNVLLELNDLSNYSNKPINLSKLSSGVYFIDIIGVNNRLIKKIIKK